MLTTIVTVVIFLVMISLHEFGHFIVSKLVGVRVHEFAIGMGPSILKWQGKETLYSLRIFPIGGYCALEGEDKKSDDEKAFCNQKWWKRFLVIVAGAVLNIILGFAIIFGINAGNEKVATPVVDSVLSEGYADDAGMLPGDRIIRINGKRINIYDDISYYTDKLTGEDVEIIVKRGDEKLTFTVKPTRETSTVYYEENGARVVSSLNGEGETEAVYEYIDKAAAKEYIGTNVTNERFIIGFVGSQEENTFWKNAKYSFFYTGFVVKVVCRGLLDLVTGKAGMEQVSGPVGIVSAVNTMVNSGSGWVKNVLNLTALLTINLGVFNLLPIPALDGGRLFFMLIELIRRKPIPAEKEGMVHAIGLLLLLLFAVVISFKDIWMLIR